MADLSKEWEDATPITSDLASEWENSAPVEQPTPPKSFLKRAQEDISKRAGNIQNISNQWEQAPASLSKFSPVGSAPFRVAGEVAGGINDVVGEGIKSIYSTVVPQGVQDMVRSGAEKVASQPLVRDVVGGISSLYGKFKQNYPETAEKVESASNIVQAIPVVRGLATVGKGAAKEAFNIAKEAKGLISTGGKVPDAVVSREIKKSLPSIIKPSVTSKSTYGRLLKESNKSVDAFKDIVANKNALSYTDEVGNVVTGQLPETVMQTAEVVSNRMDDIFKQYNALAQQAGQSGARVNLAPVINELDTIITNPVLNSNPSLQKVVEYAKKVKDSYTQVGAYDPEAAQQVIKFYNTRLSKGAFNDFSEMYVDSLVANQMRGLLDDAITNTVGSGYSDLKKMYGAYKSIENSVVKAAARKAAERSGINFVDIGTGAGLVHALTQGTSVLPAAFAESLNLVRRAMRNPDRNIARLFRKVDTMVNGPAKFQPKSITGKIATGTPMGALNTPNPADIAIAGAQGLRGEE